MLDLSTQLILLFHQEVAIELLVREGTCYMHLVDMHALELEENDKDSESKGDTPEVGGTLKVNEGEFLEGMGKTDRS
jgi:hypothetical protein